MDQHVGVDQGADAGQGKVPQQDAHDVYLPHVQQNDAEEYNKFIGAFNDKMSGYKSFYGSNSPASVPRKFKNWF